MRRGDIIEVDGQRCIVVSVTSTIATIGDELEDSLRDIAVDLDERQPELCTVVCNPTEEWPFVIAKPKTAYGLIVSVGRPTRTGAIVPLRPFYDWVVGEPLRSGGAVYFNPALNLQTGERVVLQHEAGSQSIAIPIGFANLGQRIERAKRAKAGETSQSVYDRLLADPMGDDEDD